MGPDDRTPKLDDTRRQRYRHRLKAAGNLVLGAAVGATVTSFFQPNGFAPTIAFASFVLYLLIGWVRSQS